MKASTRQQHLKNGFFRAILLAALFCVEAEPSFASQYPFMTQAQHLNARPKLLKPRSLSDLSSFADAKMALDCQNLLQLTKKNDDRPAQTLSNEKQSERLAIRLQTLEKKLAELRRELALPEKERQRRDSRFFLLQWLSGNQVTQELEDEARATEAFIRLAQAESRVMDSLGKIEERAAREAQKPINLDASRLYNEVPELHGAALASSRFHEEVLEWIKTDIDFDIETMPGRDSAEDAQESAVFMESLASLLEKMADSEQSPRIERGTAVSSRILEEAYSRAYKKTEQDMPVRSDANFILSKIAIPNKAPLSKVLDILRHIELGLYSHNDAKDILQPDDKQVALWLTLYAVKSGSHPDGMILAYEKLLRFIDAPITANKPAKFTALAMLETALATPTSAPFGPALFRIERTFEEIQPTVTTLDAWPAYPILLKQVHASNSTRILEVYHKIHWMLDSSEKTVLPFHPIDIAHLSLIAEKTQMPPEKAVELASAIQEIPFFKRRDRAEVLFATHLCAKYSISPLSVVELIERIEKLKMPNLRESFVPHPSTYAIAAAYLNQHPTTASESSAFIDQDLRKLLQIPTLQSDSILDWILEKRQNTFNFRINP